MQRMAWHKSVTERKESLKEPGGEWTKTRQKRTKNQEETRNDADFVLGTTAKGLRFTRTDGRS